MSQRPSRTIPLWLRAIGAASIAVIGAALAYAAAIAIDNLARIGV